MCIAQTYKISVNSDKMANGRQNRGMQKHGEDFLALTPSKHLQNHYIHTKYSKYIPYPCLTFCSYSVLVKKTVMVSNDAAHF